MENSRSRRVRVAVASDDGKTIRQHFGQARRFLIYEIDGDDVRLLGVREIGPPHHAPTDCDGRRQHVDMHLTERVELVLDCDAVLAAQIGPAAQSQLTQNNIMSFHATGPMDAVLSRMAQNIRRIVPKRRIAETREDESRPPIRAVFAR
jgi:nitrogen fixation protein NifB